jgi:hypothetical protein
MAWKDASHRAAIASSLTPEQAAHLATLPEGSAERRTYLHSLGSDPAVIAAQGH